MPEYTYHLVPRVACECPLGLELRTGAPVPVRARDDLDPYSPPLEYADGRISWSGHPSREARDRARVDAAQWEREEAERSARVAEEQRREDAAEAHQRRVAAVKACPGHRPVSESQERCYVGGVSTWGVTDENRRAHGGITFEQRCSCGAERRVNSNVGSREYSGWYVPETAS